MAKLSKEWFNPYPGPVLEVCGIPWTWETTNRVGCCVGQVTITAELLGEGWHMVVKEGSQRLESVSGQETLGEAFRALDKELILTDLFEGRA